MKDDILSSYLANLPAVFQADPFLGRFLLAFERLLSGWPGAEKDGLPPGLEQTLDHIHIFFNPRATGNADGQTPAEFLPWLAGWLALTLREDWDEAEKRRLMNRIVSLYRLRGTRRGLQQMLNTYLGMEMHAHERVSITEFDNPPHYFQVAITLTKLDPEQLRRQERIARAIIDHEKPAHTVYALRTLVRTMQIRNDIDWQDDRQIGLRVGRNTLLGMIAKD